MCFVGGVVYGFCEVVFCDFVFGKRVGKSVSKFRLRVVLEL